MRAPDAAGRGLLDALREEAIAGDDAHLELGWDGGDVEVRSIFVGAPRRRRGIGSAVLGRLCAACDREGLDAVLYPTSAFGVPRRALVLWYFGFGFRMRPDGTMRRVRAAA